MNTEKMLRTSEKNGDVPYTDEGEYFMIYPQQGRHTQRDVEMSVYWLHNEYPDKPVRRSTWQRAKPEEPHTPNETTDDRPA